MTPIGEHSVFVIAGNADAMRMLAVWHLVYGRRADRRAGRWAELADVPLSTVLRLSPVLLELGLALPDGTISEEAQREFLHWQLERYGSE